MNRGKFSTQVFLYFLVMMFLMVIGCSSSDDTPPPTYNISGAVSGATLAGVTINLTGTATASATTDASGNFSFTGRANGTYTVTPVKAGYTFNPVSWVVVVSGASVTNANSMATTYVGSTYSISGTVSGAASSGVTITLGGANTGSGVTGTGGTYSISGLVPGSYTVTPSLTGFTFSPTSSAVTITAADSTANNFAATAIPVAHSISGTVSGATLSGVTITVTGTATATATTDAAGSYTVTGLYDGGYTVTPSKTGYTFTPSSSAVTMSGATVTGKNFTAAVYIPPTHSIFGAVSGDVLSGVTITLSGAGSATTTTNTSGNYSFSGIADGSYTMTPSRTGYTFAPSSRAATVSGADFTVPNFVATAIPGTYTASGTSTWNSTTGVITLNTTSTNFICRGPSLGTETHTGVTITSTTMTWPNDNEIMTWSRSSGTANDIVGTWTTTDTTGNSYTATINANGTFSVVGVIVSCGGGGGIPGTYTQADLTGTWNMNNLRQDKWTRAQISINSSGVATCVSMSDSGGGTACPSPFDLTLTMNTSTGVITQTGANAANAGTDHMTMTSNKNFMAGTATNGTSPNYKYPLVIIQKVMPGTVYTNADLRNKSFVYHQLRVGSFNEWEYGAATTDAAGSMTITSSTMSDGTTGSGPTGMTISVNSNGVVTMSGDLGHMTGFEGFLSDDKKTIVGTATNSGTGWTSYGLMIIQITGQTYTAGLLPAGISAVHMLVCGSSPAPFWLHFTATVASGGVTSFSDWVSSNPSITISPTRTGSITSSGTVTLAEVPSFHGQVSHDGKFTVATQTPNTGVYSLQVNTK